MQNVKWIAVMLIIGSTAWIGFRMAYSLRKTDRQMREMIKSLDIMETELKYTETKFNPLCRLLQQRCRGETSRFYMFLAEDSQTDTYQSVGATVRNAERAGLKLPPAALLAIEQLIDPFGRYDLNGQLKQLSLSRAVLQGQSEQFHSQLSNRCKTYELLGICTGIAIMILVI